jgi:hypothetical protein
MLSPIKAGWSKKYSHSKLVLKWNNVSPTSIRSSAHLLSLPGMVHCPEMYSDDDDDDEEEEEEEDDDENDNEDEDEDDQEDEDDDDNEDDVNITSGLQHSLKIRNYASNSSYHNHTNNYDNNDDDASSSSDHSTIGDGSVSNDDYEDNDDDAKDANHA